jgi:hypothetical protein
MGTNQTHGSFQDILAVAKPELRPICESLRRLVASLHPGFVEITWPKHKIASFGTGPKKLTEHYAYIGVQRSHVNLGFYHGASLPDPTGILEGDGKKLRHVKIRSASAVANITISALLREAIKERALHTSDA